MLWKLHEKLCFERPPPLVPFTADWVHGRQIADGSGSAKRFSRVEAKAHWLWIVNETLQIARHVLSFLDGRSLYTAAAVCRWWRALSEHDHVWKRFNNGSLNARYWPIFTLDLMNQFHVKICAGQGAVLFSSKNWATFVLTTFYTSARISAQIKIQSLTRKHKVYFSFAAFS
jgi:hypothetical protein